MPEFEAATVRLDLARKIWRTGKQDEAFALYREFAAQFAESEDPSVRKSVADVLLFVGEQSRASGDRCEAARSAFDQVIRRFGDDTEPDLLARVANALTELAHLAAVKPNGKADAIALYDDALRRFGHTSDPRFAVHVAQSLQGKASCLFALRKRDDAIVVLDDLLQRYGSSTEPELAEVTVSALCGKARALARMGRDAEARVLRTALVDRVSQDEPRIVGVASHCLRDIGMDLLAQGDSRAALEVFDALISQLGGDEDADLRQCVALSLMYKSHALAQLGDFDAAQAAQADLVVEYWQDGIAAFDSEAQRFGNSAEPADRARRAAALQNKAAIMLAVEQTAQAFAVFSAVVDEFQEDDSTLVQGIVAQARAQRELLIEDAPENPD